MYTHHHTKFPRILFLVVFILAFFFHGQAHGENKQFHHPNKNLLIVGIDADYAPLEYVDDEGNPHGYDIEFTNLLMKRMGIKFTYAPNSWENIAGDVLHGRVDLGMMIYSPYRKDSTNYSRAVFRLYYQIVYRKNEENTFNLRNLRGKRIAYMNSRPVSQKLAEEEAIGQNVTNLGKAMNDLAAGKYDAIICFRYQARYFITHFELDNLKAEDMSMPPREYCYVSYNKELIDAINKELMAMEEEGITDSIYGKDIEEKFSSIEIPRWVWTLLSFLIFTFLMTLVIGFRISNKRLAAERQKLLDANTLLGEKNRELIEANERAEESSRMKTSFIQQISHEIRTPLNVINGFTQVLTTSEMELSEVEKTDIGQRMEENTERITGLVNKMLELSDASSLTVIERKDLVSAELIALQAISDSKIENAENLTFDLQIDPEAIPLTIQTNLRQASRALSLLLDNAKKYVQQGRACLRISCSNDPSCIIFSVEDTGIGVPPEKAENIFEPFVQLDSFYDGTGIGLTVARSIARRLGGDIVLDTSYRPGARFIMTLWLTTQAESN